MSAERERLSAHELLLLALVLAVALGLAFSLLSCRTVEAIALTPEETWGSLWTIVEALALDLWDIVSLVL